MAPILVSRDDQQDFVVGLYIPLTPNLSPHPELNKLNESQTVPFIFVDDLVVQRNLPHATISVLEWPGLD